MKRPVFWSRDALDDIKEQVRFIAGSNPNAAKRVADRLAATGAALGALATGRPGRVSGTYEKSVPNLPYIVVYALLAHEPHERIVIVRVIHAARDWPDEDWPH